MEIWKQFRNSFYSVSSDGRVRNNKTKKILKPQKRKGYLRVGMSLEFKKPKKYSLHKVVAETFLEDYDEELYVDHINRVRSDNQVSNLRMLTHEENMKNKVKTLGYVEHIIQLHKEGKTAEEIYETIIYPSF